MQKYNPDYIKLNEAMDKLNTARVFLLHSSGHKALQCIREVRATLKEYLSQDNMIPDDDTASGWYRSQDVDNR